MVRTNRAFAAVKSTKYEILQCGFLGNNFKLTALLITVLFMGCVASFASAQSYNSGNNELSLAYLSTYPYTYSEEHPAYLSIRYSHKGQWRSVESVPLLAGNKSDMNFVTGVSLAQQQAGRLMVLCYSRAMSREIYFHLGWFSNSGGGPTFFEPAPSYDLKANELNERNIDYDGAMGAPTIVHIEDLIWLVAFQTFQPGKIFVVPLVTHNQFGGGLGQLLFSAETGVSSTRSVVPIPALAYHTNRLVIAWGGNILAATVIIDPRTYEIELIDQIVTPVHGGRPALHHDGNLFYAAIYRAIPGVGPAPPEGTTWTSHHMDIYSSLDGVDWTLLDSERSIVNGLSMASTAPGELLLSVLDQRDYDPRRNPPWQEPLLYSLRGSSGLALRSNNPLFNPLPKLGPDIGFSLIRSYRPPTVARTGPDREICEATTTLKGNRPKSRQTGKWSIGSGNGGSFSNAASYNSSFTGVPGNRYTLRWTISEPPYPAVSELVRLNFINATKASAGSDQKICGNSAILDNNKVAAGESGEWSKVSGNGGAFETRGSRGLDGTPMDIRTYFSGLPGEAYELKWTITSSTCVSSDTVASEFFEEPTTAVADTNGKKTPYMVCGTMFRLAENRPVVGTGKWSIEQGNGGSIQTQSIVSRDGTVLGEPYTFLKGIAGSSYTLRWTISNPPCQDSFDEIKVKFVEQPTIANAGPDSTTCGLTASLLGNTPVIGTGLWTSSDSDAIFTAPTDPNTMVTASTLGSHSFTWTISNAPCMPSVDEVIVDFVENPTTAVADTNGKKTLYRVCGTSIRLAENRPIVGTGRWSIIKGSGGSVQPRVFANSGGEFFGKQYTIFKGLPGQRYTLRWTISNPPCPDSFDEITVKFVKQPTIANAGPDAVACGISTRLMGNKAVVGQGRWSVINGEGGSFKNQRRPKTIFSGAAGVVYKLKWTISNDPCPSSSDEVTIEFDNTEPSCRTVLNPVDSNGNTLFNAVAIIISDPSGIQSIDFQGYPSLAAVQAAPQANLSVLDSWGLFQPGITSPLTLTARPDNNSSPPSFTLIVTDNCGNVNICEVP